MENTLQPGAPDEADEADRARLADGFEAALIGIGTQFTHDVAIYDYARCVDILVERDGMTPDEAVEFIEFNVTGAWIGPHTPVFLRHHELADYLAALGIDEDLGSKS
jgi:hypothetical protein